MTEQTWSVLLSRLQDVRRELEEGMDVPPLLRARLEGELEQWRIAAGWSSGQLCERLLKAGFEAEVREERVRLYWVMRRAPVYPSTRDD